MDISIVGATGTCAREIVIQIIRDRLLEQREILQLVNSNPNSSHPYFINGFRADLQDAYAEIIPEIDVTSSPSDIIGDIVVMAGGATFKTDPREVGSASRDMLAQVNKRIFERFAQQIMAARPDNPPIVIIVSNPIELAVQVFSKYLPRDHIIGMGAYSDSLRFRWEIAHDLGIRRQRVHGYVLGEHGTAMVPLWSTVRVHGINTSEWNVIEKRLRGGLTTQAFPERLLEEQQTLIEMLKNDPLHGPQKALLHVSTLPPDLRVALKPFAIHYTQAKTVEATANASVELIKSIIGGRPMEIAAQYMHAGESGIHCPFGARLIIAGTVERLLPIEGYRPEEMELIEQSASIISEKLKEWMADE